MVLKEAHPKKTRSQTHSLIPREVVGIAMVWVSLIAAFIIAACYVPMDIFNYSVGRTFVVYFLAPCAVAFIGGILFLSQRSKGTELFANVMGAGILLSLVALILLTVVLGRYSAEREGFQAHVTQEYEQEHNVHGVKAKYKDTYVVDGRNMVVFSFDIPGEKHELIGYMGQDNKATSHRVVSEEELAKLTPSRE